jgi:hypothetical protein
MPRPKNRIRLSAIEQEVARQLVERRAEALRIGPGKPRDEMAELAELRETMARRLGTMDVMWRAIEEHAALVVTHPAQYSQRELVGWLWAWEQARVARRDIARWRKVDLEER